MFFVFHRRHLAAAVALVVFLCAFSTLLWQGASVAVFQEDTLQEPARVVVIDAGHGGEDGGAVADDGTVESKINLEIALKLREVFFLAGIDTVMTREEDISIYSEDAETLREKKVSDLHNRVELINGVNDAILISIHQNSLPNAKSVHGAQVFYNDSEEGAFLSGTMQKNLNAVINGDENQKKEKQIDSSVYLMSHIACPGILVECGFLSNAAETQLLKESSYQLKIALTVAASYLQHQFSIK